MPSNYNNAAWFYDRLSRLVYGRTLINAQTALLPLIPKNSSILIAGGGTGWIIEEVAKIHPSGLTIFYVELSEKMMTLSRQKNPGDNKIIYMNSPVEDASLNNDFDVIITSFLFDNFLPENFNRVFYHLHGLLKPGGLWINTDFQLSGKWWQPLLLKSMYLFFKLLGCMEAKGLTDITSYFQKECYQKLTQKSFFNDFILSTAYKN